MLLFKISQIKIFYLHLLRFCRITNDDVFNWNKVAFENNKENVVLDDQTQQNGFQLINKTWTYHKVYQQILNRFFHLNFCSLNLNNGKILWMWVIPGPRMVLSPHQATYPLHQPPFYHQDMSSPHQKKVPSHHCNGSGQWNS